MSRSSPSPAAIVAPLVASVGGLAWLLVRGVSLLDLAVVGAVVAVWAFAVRAARVAGEARAESTVALEREVAPERAAPAHEAPAPVEPVPFAPMDLGPLTASIRSGFGATKQTMTDAGEEISRCETLMRESVEGLLSSFGGLKDQAQHQRSMLVTLINELSGGEVGSDNGVLPRFINETDVVMRDFVEYILSVSKQSMAMASRMADITKEMDRIQTVTDRARQLARSTSLLALNAKIEAAQAGRQAAGFGVIADEVQALAKESHDFNEQISGLVSGVRRTIDETEAAIGVLASRDMNQAIQARSRADELAQEVKVLNHHMQDSLREVTSIAEVVDTKVADAVRALQFDDIVRQVLQHSALILRRGEDLTVEVSRALEWQEDPEDIAARVQAKLDDHSHQLQGLEKAVQQDSMQEGAIELF